MKMHRVDTKDYEVHFLVDNKILTKTNKNVKKNEGLGKS